MSRQICKPFIKWPGGKSEEISIIHKFLPDSMENYIEPFLGGGACFLSLQPEQYKHAYVNDLSVELIRMFKLVKERDSNLLKYLNDIWFLWEYSGELYKDNSNEIIEYYKRYLDNDFDNNKLEKTINSFIDKTKYVFMKKLPTVFLSSQNELTSELKKSILSKIKNVKRKELKVGSLPHSDYSDNMEAGIKAGVYTYLRYLYNNPAIYNNQTFQIALFFYIREFCYSSMFRYNKKGEFNVPYGGKSYNNKNFRTKIEYLKDEGLLSRLSKATFYCKDFMDFLESIRISENDFMFLDPPYDGGFNTYAKNEFSQDDQIRLANYLIKECNAKFMLVIKNTAFIHELYSGHNNISIIGFNKDYRVSFMDRNNKKAEHLLIKNY